VVLTVVIDTRIALHLLQASVNNAPYFSSLGTLHLPRSDTRPADILVAYG
jgi:hypothetical protein